MKKSRVTVVGLQALAAKPPVKQLELSDPEVRGGYIFVRAGTGTLSYVLRVRSGGKNRKLTIGQFRPEDGGLAEARRKARAAITTLEAGGDPFSEKAARKKAVNPAPPTDTVAAIVDDYLRLHVERNAKGEGRETRRVIRAEILPRWGARSMASITPDDIRNFVREKSVTAPVGANRFLGRVKSLFGWAAGHGLIPSDPTEKVRTFTSEKGRAKVRFLSDDELARIWRASDALGPFYSSAVKLLILTGCRRSEISGMRHSEIEGAIFHLPAERSKNGVALDVYLSPLAQEILAGVPKIAGNPFVFGRELKGGWWDALRRLDRVMLKDGPLPPSWTPHDLRRTFATGLARLGVPIHVTERTLNHITGSSVGGLISVYQRHDYADECRAAWERWSVHIQAITSGDTQTKVIHLREGKKAR